MWIHGAELNIKNWLRRNTKLFENIKKILYQRKIREKSYLTFKHNNLYLIIPSPWRGSVDIEGSKVRLRCVVLHADAGLAEYGTRKSFVEWTRNYLIWPCHASSAIQFAEARRSPPHGRTQRRWSKQIMLAAERQEID